MTRRCATVTVIAGAVADLIYRWAARSIERAIREKGLTS